jgi:hypothetical protein
VLPPKEATCGTEGGQEFRGSHSIFKLVDKDVPTALVAQACMQSYHVAQPFRVARLSAVSNLVLSALLCNPHTSSEALPEFLCMHAGCCDMHMCRSVRACEPCHHDQHDLDPDFDP